ncbi:MAG TPA: type II secretion system F family protein [Egibacteraceae bacterium]|nr:type II secretion system F family protein [Egibacteraceae bacterium]
MYIALGLATGRAPQLTRPRRARPDQSQTWLLQAGLKLTPAQFWAGSAALAAAAFLLVALMTTTPAVALAPALWAGLVPRVYFARQRARRLREIQQAWPDGLRQLVAGIAAGMSLPQAMADLASVGPEPLRRAFSRFPSLVRVVGMTPALELVREELADPTSDRVIEVLILAHERGGRIVSDILRDLAEATTQDLQALEQIATDSLEQKINARAVFALPWIVLLALTARPGHFREFYRSPGGLVVVVIAGALSLVGMAIVARLSRDPVEQRVLGRPHEPVTGREPA